MPIGEHDVCGIGAATCSLRPLKGILKWLSHHRIACACNFIFTQCRRAMLHYVLLPALRFAPLAFQVSALQERAPKLRGVLSRSPEAAPSLM